MKLNLAYVLLLCGWQYHFKLLLDCDFIMQYRRAPLLGEGNRLGEETCRTPRLLVICIAWQPPAPGHSLTYGCDLLELHKISRLLQNVFDINQFKMQVNRYMHGADFNDVLLLFKLAPSQLPWQPLQWFWAFFQCNSWIPCRLVIPSRFLSWKTHFLILAGSAFYQI